MADLHVDAVSELCAIEFCGRWMAVDRIRPIDCNSLVVTFRAKAFGKTDAVEVFGIKIADCCLPTLMLIIIISRGVGCL